MGDGRREPRAGRTVRAEIERATMDACSDCLKVLDTDGVVLQMNRSGLRDMEIEDFETVRGASWWSLWPESSRAQVQRAVERAAMGETVTFHAPCPTARGRPKQWDVTVSPIREGTDGPVVCLLAVSTDVTERDEREELMRLQTRLVDAVEQAVIATDLQGRITYWNRFAEQLYGWSHDEAVGRSVVEVTPADDAHAKAEEIMGQLLRGQRWLGEFRVRRRDGSEFWAHITDSPIHDEGGSLAGVIGVSYDVTEQRLARQCRAVKLAISQILVDADDMRDAAPEILQALCRELDVDVAELWVPDASADHLVLKSTRARSSFEDARRWEATARQLVGSPPRGVVADAWRTRQPTWSEAIADDSWPARQSLASECGIDVGIAFPLADQPVDGIADPGVIAAYGTHLLPDRALLETVDEIRRNVGGFVQRCANQRALRDSEQRFKDMANTAPAMIWITDRRYACTFLSRGWHEFTGQFEAEGVGLGWLQAIHPEDRQRAHDTYMRAAERREPFALDYRLRTREGDYRWTIAAGRPRFSEAGDWLGYIGSVIDVHERKLAEQAVAESDRRKDEFLAMLGHELRNPLAAIRSATELLAFVQADDPDIRRAQTVIDRQGRQMTRLVDGLLEVSRIARGKISLQPELLDLRAVVDRVMQDRGSEIDERGVALIAEIPSEPVWVSGDEVRLVQVFDNLLSNAIRFTDPPGRITVGLRRADGNAIAWVRDEGQGISPSMLERIFEPFQQEAHDLARTNAGLGLGLALASRIVELHQGTIEAHSEGRGLGAELRVRLPLAVGR